jgi:hypothetical protein
MPLLALFGCGLSEANKRLIQSKSLGEMKACESSVLHLSLVDIIVFLLMQLLGSFCTCRIRKSCLINAATRLRGQPCLDL